MEEPYNFFPRTRKAMEMIEDAYNEFNDSLWDGKEFDENKTPILDHSMMYLAQALYDDGSNWAMDLYDYLGALIREEERNQNLRGRKYG